MKIGYAGAAAAAGDKQKAQSDALKKSGCRKIFIEEAFESGSEGTKLNEAIDACGAGDALVVSRLSGLGGTLKNVVGTIDLLREKGVGFISLEEGIDTTEKGGEQLLRVIEALASLQKKTTSERTKAGMAAARSRGNSAGRPRAVSEKTLAKAKAMRDESGMSIAEICKKLKIGRSTFYRYLKA
jgi:DNA invertase Pin-like site-specific DNA recombinase